MKRIAVVVVALFLAVLLVLVAWAWAPFALFALALALLAGLRRLDTCLPSDLLPAASGAAPRAPPLA